MIKKIYSMEKSFALSSAKLNWKKEKKEKGHVWYISLNFILS